uniref:Parvalbumin n=1 Tax=Periophthalmus magnuspinnatus TaxID=409849 RepID=A0A3B3Z8X7_9GOBI
MEDDFRPQVQRVAVAMGASLSDQEVNCIPREFRRQDSFDYRCFLEHMRQFRTEQEKEAAIKKAFTQLDRDHSGFIEWNEIKYILSTVPDSAPVVPLSDEEAESVLRAADKDGDGRIDFNEFSELVTQEKKPKK